MNWLKRFLLSRYLKSVFDKLPLDGKKTYVGFILFVLAELANVVCSSADTVGVCGGITLAQQVLSGLGIPATPRDVAIAAATTFAVGLWHKVLKAFHSEDEKPEAPVMIQ